MPATPSRSAEQPAVLRDASARDGSGGPRIASRLRAHRPRLRRPSLWPRTFRARLALVISAVVAFALLLVLAILPRLLDGYFRQQEDQNLRARAAAVGQLLYQQVRLAERGGLVPILNPTTPPTVSAQVLDALTAEGDTPQETSYLAAIAQVVAQADVQVAFYAGPTATGKPVQVLQVSLPPAADAGQQREAGQASGSFTVPDLYWSQFSSSVPVRSITYTLSQPYTFRNQTLRDVIGVLIVVAVSALSLAVIVAFLLADRLTTPIRRLTHAAHALAEGDLDTRVSVSSSGAPELTELSNVFNLMAQRLQETMDYIRRDRDRSRDFVADVSHELRTPIAALRTFNELLQDGAVDDPGTRAEFLESSRQQIERLDWLATNLLELSKLDSGLVALDLRPDDLRSVAQSAVEQALPSARRQGVEVTLDLPPHPLRQRHDPRRLGQVLANLVGNAVKFTPSGGHVWVVLRPTQEGARIVVRDTGVGIDAAELPHVFDRFYRGSRASEVRAGGSGLGLSIARSIVEMHGGRIGIASRVGQGTEVTVDLPRDIHPTT